MSQPRSIAVAVSSRAARYKSVSDGSFSFSSSGSKGEDFDAIDRRPDLGFFLARLKQPREVSFVVSGHK